ncbi:CGNR zinc finger domain-containing protein [Catenuloplanes atrovinosus]|uniref:RNA-binding Zn ribbon-like protein n=1 Tax=Catenuloplanes atrovinosus TaxID=137266 RepID=A0AAE3YLH1_9ACTN|nr:ABATE domain-containing protein [Catenuloplanes atrovinosus]MDR7274413.1 putative RNA-binding Zn ribbon-like protein [Catenuloplanes atrovinosus]
MEFVFIGGNLALDLLGTLKWRRTAPEEFLRTPADAARWAVESGVVTVAPRVTEAELESLRALRETIYRLVTGPSAARADVAALNAAAAGPRVETTLTAAGARRTGGVAAVAADVATAAITLLGDVRTGRETRLRECERPDCTRLFLDRSRGRTRSWCGMAECGNRVKAAEYRARKAAVRTSRRTASPSAPGDRVA